MSDVLIRIIERNDKRGLRSCLVTGGLRGVYHAEVHTGDVVMKRQDNMEDAEARLKRHPLYLIETGETGAFPCVQQVSDWKGYDVFVRLRLQIRPEEKSFGCWLTKKQDPTVWDNDGKTVSAEAIAQAVQDRAGYGLESYVRQCLAKANLELLRQNGADSWPHEASEIKIRTPWLSVSDEAEEVRIVPHRPTVRVARLGVGSVLMGQYRLEERLGQGGMGQVWRARDAHLDKDVAIKILTEGASKELENTIRQEAVSLSGLGHPNIANMRGYHVDGGIAFMVIDFVQGQTLESILEKICLPEETALNWLRPIAEAIDHIHERGIVHRDIKPSNIMIGRTASVDPDETERAYLCDFGIASKSFAVTRYASGTESYRAPEIRAGKAVTPEADVYSFAMTAYRCLTGDVFDPDSSDAASNSDLLRAVMKGLARKPAERPKRCIDLLVPIPAQPKPPSYSPPKETAASRNEGEVVLPEDVIRNYLQFLQRCGKKELADNLKNKLLKKTRMGWCVTDMPALIWFLEEVPYIPVHEAKTMGAEDRRQELVAWFTNHKIDMEYDVRTISVLNGIRDNITEEEWI